MPRNVISHKGMRKLINRKKQGLPLPKDWRETTTFYSFIADKRVMRTKKSYEEAIRNRKEVKKAMKFLDD